MAQNDLFDSPAVPREAIADVHSEADFVDFLRRRLEWPIPVNIERLADVTIPHDLQKDFGFSPEEDRISVSRLLNLTEDQPWGIFLFEFKTKRSYLSHLRRLLRALGSQRTLRKGDPIWNRNDLLFICTPDWQEYQFVHFSGEKPESAVISSFGWKGPDDPFLYTLCRHNLPQLRMPQSKADGGFEPEGWRTAWRDAFNIKPVTDEFYATLKEVFDAVQAGVKGLKGDDRRFFAELVVNRMIFLKFVERKGWLEGDRDYLFNRFKQHGRQNYWKNFLCDFFFEALCKEKEQRTKKLNHILGDVPFLNAELFAPSEKWNDWDVQVDNRVFDLLFEKLLNPYNFTVCETSPLDVEVAFNQDLLGYGYEELIADQHGQGAYYTLPTEVNLMCRESLRAYLEAKCPAVEKDLIGKLVYGELNSADRVPEKDALALYRALHDVTVVDPALGSGTFPVAMMKHLFAALRTLGRYLQDSAEFKRMLKQDGITDPDDAFALKLHIIERSIYGCDIDYFAVQIAKLRFWIELMVHCEKPEALPNFNCKLVVGDALVSAVGTDARGNLITLENLLGHPTKDKSLLAQKQVDELARLKSDYFTVRDTRNRQQLEDKIAAVREDLLRQLGVQTDRLKLTDKHILWQVDFAEIFASQTPGFDIAIANPPYLRQELIDQSFAALGLSVDKSSLQTVYESVLDLVVGGQADLYVYFYLRSHMLCKQTSGLTCFICSNNWLDAAYGKSLQFFLLRHCALRLILENRFKRSFEAADINTVITLFCAESIVSAKEPCLFLALKQPFTCYDLNRLISGALSHDKSLFLQSYTANIVTKQQLLDMGQGDESRVSLLRSTQKDYDGGKWGGIYLRAPSVYFKIIVNNSHGFVPLATIATMRRGFTTGANDFFYLTVTSRTSSMSQCATESGETFDIENRFLCPTIRNTRECVAYKVTPAHASRVLFVCSESRAALKGTHAERFISWGESQGVHTRPTCRPRDKWWDIGQRAPWPIWWIIAHNERDGAFLNEGLLCGDNFFEIIPGDSVSVAFLFAVLSSSWVVLQRELYGRSGFGGGLLKTQGPDVRRLMIPNPRDLAAGNVADVEKAGTRLCRSTPVSIHDAWANPARAALDVTVMRCLGMGEEGAREVYDEARALVSARQDRSTRKETI